MGLVVFTSLMALFHLKWNAISSYTYVISTSAFGNVCSSFLEYLNGFLAVSFLICCSLCRDPKEIMYELIDPRRGVIWCDIAEKHACFLNQYAAKWKCSRAGLGNLEISLTFSRMEWLKAYHILKLDVRNSFKDQKDAMKVYFWWSVVLCHKRVNNDLETQHFEMQFSSALFAIILNYDLKTIRFVWLSRVQKWFPLIRRSQFKRRRPKWKQGHSREKRQLLVKTQELSGVTKFLY